MPSTTATTQTPKAVETPKETPKEPSEAASDAGPFLSDMEPFMIEKAFRSALGKAKIVAKSDLATEEVIMAKMVDYAIREVHSRGVRPLTAIRAMMIMEIAEERRSITGAINQAFRELKAESKARREAEVEEEKEDGENIKMNGHAGR